jgi:hypothetical protein
MYQLTEQDLQTIKSSFGPDLPSVNGVNIVEFIIGLSYSNSHPVEQPTEAPTETPTQPE